MKFVQFLIPRNFKLLSMVREHVKILVIGAGGLGCELLKNLVGLHLATIIKCRL